MEPYKTCKILLRRIKPRKRRLETVETERQCMPMVEYSAWLDQEAATTTTRRVADPGCVLKHFIYYDLTTYYYYWMTT